MCMSACYTYRACENLLVITTERVSPHVIFEGLRFIYFKLYNANFCRLKSSTDQRQTIYLTIAPVPYILLV